MVIAAGSLMTMDIEGTPELQSVSGNRAEIYAAHAGRNICSMDHFLTHYTPPTMLALMNNLRHLVLPGDDPKLHFLSGRTRQEGPMGCRQMSLARPQRWVMRCRWHGWESRSKIEETTAAAKSYLPSTALPHRSSCDTQPHLSWWRHSSGPHQSINSSVRPGIGEGEMSPVHSIIQFGRLNGNHLKHRLVSSIDTDQCVIILLTMSSGCITPKGFDAVQAIVKRFVDGSTRYILDRVYSAIENLRDGSESAWPADGQYHWLTQSLKLILSVLSYLLTRCDPLPHVSGITFFMMWDLF